MSEWRLPIYVRWTLAAEGCVLDERTARPRCPVAAWIVDRDPHLLPAEPDPERLTAVRVRADLVDDLLLQLRDAHAGAGREMSVWSVGAGFDARWARLAGPLSPVVARWVEVEEPKVLHNKHWALAGSPFHELYDRVESVPMVAAGWDVPAEPHEWPVVLLMGLLHRVPAAGLRTLLRRIRKSAPQASVLLDLTGVHGRARAGWSERRLAQVGWRVVDDVELAFRDVVFTPDGDEVAAGMVPVRVQHLMAL